MDPIDRLLAYWHRDAALPIGPIEATVIKADLTLDDALSSDRFRRRGDRRSTQGHVFSPGAGRPFTHHFLSEHGLS